MERREVPPLSSVKPVEWADGTIIVIDQRRLPHELVYRELRNVEEAAQAIEQMVVRGAPLIGIVAAYAMAQAALHDPSPGNITDALTRLNRTRPTARDLFAALERLKRVHALKERVYDALLGEARDIHQEDLSASAIIACHAPQVFTVPGWVVTICNTGALATGGEGTALGLIVEGYRQGLVDGVYVMETRPRLQGARLTCWELSRLGVPFQLIPDSAAATVLARTHSVAAVSGADRIALNGDTANKLGTRMLAILARHHGVPFHVAAPHTTFDRETADGAGIPIEERDGGEVRNAGSAALVPGSFPVFNPSFDITPAELVSSYVTNRGVLTPESLRESNVWN
jgi:methylthioribose-1-phosphate isomerase